MPSLDDFLIVFPDTNFFLECRTPEECPWGQITSVAEICLVVCRGVRREIDRLKNAGRGRKSDRARRLSSQLREVGQHGRLVLREIGPRVTLGAARIVPALVNPPAELDPNYPDDAIILDILGQVVANPSLSPVLLTDDGNAADTARHVGLRVIDLPFDEPGNARWRLDPEPDGVQRRLNEMERRLNLVMKQGPDLRIAFRDTSGNEVDQLQIEAVHYPPLQSSEVDELLGRVAALHPSPEFSLPSVGDPMLLHGLSDAARQQNYRAAAYLLLPDTKAIRRYEEVERPTWLGKVRERLEHAHWLLSLEHNQIALAIQLENRGSVPARSLLVRLQARGRAMLCLPPGVSKVPGPGLDELLLRLPAPPTPPKPRSSFLEDLSGLNLFHRTDGIPEPEMRRDPRALYWRSEHKGLRQDWEIE